jgi:RHS repeat-associated protein
MEPHLHPQPADQPIAELDQSGNWTDYIYANGRKIAKVPSTDTRIRISGTTLQTGFEWGLGINTPNSPVIQTGDQVCWRQYNAGAVGGLNFQLSVSGGISWLPGATTSDGQEINQDYLENGWLYRTVSLNAFVGKTADYIVLTKDLVTPAATYSIYFADIAIVSADGTVSHVFNGEPLSIPSWQGLNPAYDTSFTVAVETVPISQDPTVPAGGSGNFATHFYLGDHLGTAQMEFAWGGWPVWQGQFAPYGQELHNGSLIAPDQPDPTTANHYKFTGKERDTESGLDYFGARYYASNMGRWMSPDWSAKEDPVPYAKLDDPQSLNLYGYVGNNPLSRADADGHEGCCDALVNFAVGAFNAWGSDNLLGAGRVDQTTSAGAAGARLGDAIAAVQGVAETIQGAGAVLGGGAEALVTSPAAGTGVGVIVPAAGAAAAVVGAAEVVHGVATAGTAVTALMKGGGPKAANAPGITAGGQATDAHGK